jgi:hypothetical protein
VQSIYELTMGNGTKEVVTMPAASSCQITLEPQAMLMLSSTHDCPSVRAFGTTVRTNLTICAVTNYQWELQLQDLSEPIFYVNGGSSRNLSISTLLGFESNSTYNIRCRPVFANGLEGMWGPMSCLITGSAGLISNPGGEFQMADFDRQVAEVEVFPNPVNDQFMNYVAVGFENELKGKIEIMDGFGRLVYTSQTIIQNDVINEIEVPSDWSNGVYFIRIIAAEGVVTHKFMIQR